jgi:stalled ribosome rescue protein Dom34
VILVSGELVRLVQIEQAEASEPPDSTYELSLGDWRPFGGSAGGSPARGLQSTAHEERYRARVEAQRDQLFETAARQTGKRLEALGWERIVLVSETQVVSRFREALPPEVAERVIAESDSNLAGEEPAAIADAIEPLIEEAWQTRSNALVELARDRARAGGPATIGAQETFGALTEGRVEHLILDPDRDLSTTGSIVPPLIEGRSELLGERAVEAAIATSAQVTAVSAVTSPVLAELGGIAALLRY